MDRLECWTLLLEPVVQPDLHRAEEAGGPGSGDVTRRAQRGHLQPPALQHHPGRDGRRHRLAAKYYAAEREFALELMKEIDEAGAIVKEAAEDGFG